VFRVERGPDKRVGRVNTKPTGKFVLREDAEPGRYYATVAPKTVADVGNCAKVRSKKVRVQ